VNELETKNTPAGPESNDVAPGADCTARLSVILASGLITSFQQGLLAYALPLYFPARALPHSAWEMWGMTVIFGWLFAPILTWLLARRIGERRVWALGLTLTAAVCGWLAILPTEMFGWRAVVGTAGFLYGSVGALTWISGMSLVQHVPEEQRGRSNSLVMIALVIGSIAAPTLGRLALALLGRFSHEANYGFFALLWSSAVLSLMGGALIYFWGEHHPKAGGPPPVTSRPSLSDDLRLIRSKRFLLMVIPLSLLAGPIFQAVNVYLAYRASDPYIGLIRHSQDHGWVTLQVVSYVAQLVGGVLLGLVAGKRASTWIAALLLAGFASCCISIGIAPGALLLFASAVAFEVCRQFMRWLQTGYVSEHVPVSQHSAAISVSILLSSIGGSGFMVLSRWLQSPDSPSFSSTLPFLVAGTIGGLGVIILIIGAQRMGRASDAAGVGGVPEEGREPE
jgi:Na+/melibiose symporter-like transporter